MKDNAQILAEVLAQHKLSNPCGSLRAKNVAQDFFAQVIREGDVNQPLDYDDGSNGLEKRTPTQIAAQAANDGELIKLIEASAKVDVNLYRRAAELSNTELIDKILARGMPIDAPDEYNYTAIHSAAGQCDRPNGIKILEHLLDRGADFYAGAWGWKNTALHTQISNERPQTAIPLIGIAAKRKLSLETPDRDGKTALHLACMVGLEDVVNSLIAAGANVHAVDRFGRTPLHYAALRGKEDIARALLKADAKPNVQDTELNTPLHLCYSGEKSLRDLFDMVDINPDRGASVIGNEGKGKPGEGSVFKASMDGRCQIAQALIAVGAVQNIPNQSGEIAYDLSRSAFTGKGSSTVKLRGA